MKHLLFSFALCLLTIGAQAQQQCKSTTQKQTQCRRLATINGYCSQHNPQAARCAGTTKAGKPCRAIPAKGHLYCYHHSK